MVLVSGATAPIFLLTSGDTGGHLIIHTTPDQAPGASQRIENTEDCQGLLKGTNQTLEVIPDNEAGCSSGSSSRGLSTPIGSGMLLFYKI